MTSIQKKKSISTISVIHYCKFILRTVMLVAFTAVYLVWKVKSQKTFSLIESVKAHPFISFVIWLYFAIEMVLRYFPSKIESIGAQKHFKCNYIPTHNTYKKPKSVGFRALMVALAWFASNGAIAALYFTKIIDQGVLVIVTLSYAVGDMVCILFFCPFQTWLLKNRCCVTCRIYNWDFAMMFTPFIFIPGIYTWSLSGMSLGLLAIWEILHAMHPERFSDSCNKSLSCSHCSEQLCSHKLQLSYFWVNNKDKLTDSIYIPPKLHTIKGKTVKK